MRRPTSVLLATIMVAALVAAGCGDDDDGGGSASPADGETSTLEVTLAADSISVTGGVVEVVLEVPTDEIEVDLTRVDEGTTVDEFREAIATTIGGGPFPDFMQTNVGVTAVAAGTVRQHVILEPGSSMAWAERPQDDDGEGEDDEEDAPSAADLLAQAFTVVAGPDGDLPATDGTITAEDYDFEIDVEAGDTYTFANDGPAHTYAAVCFISDRSGGPPHVLGHDMWKVFTVD